MAFYIAGLKKGKNASAGPGKSYHFQLFPMNVSNQLKARLADEVPSLTQQNQLLI
jgi:hypothetical protein